MLVSASLTNLLRSAMYVCCVPSLPANGLLFTAIVTDSTGGSIGIDCHSCQSIVLTGEDTGMGVVCSGALMVYATVVVCSPANPMMSPALNYTSILVTACHGWLTVLQEE
jgi:hypothetical protein